MKLDRNVNQNGKGKYAVIRLRLLAGNPQTPQELAAAILANPESVVVSYPDSTDEFFVLMLKDRHTRAALLAYADDAYRYGTEATTEWAREVTELAQRSGRHHAGCKAPD